MQWDINSAIKEKQSTDIYYDMHELQKFNMSERIQKQKHYTLYDCIYMKGPEKENL